MVLYCVKDLVTDNGTQQKILSSGHCVRIRLLYIRLGKQKTKTQSLLVNMSHRLPFCYNLYSMPCENSVFNQSKKYIMTITKFRNNALCVRK